MSFRPRLEPGPGLTGKTQTVYCRSESMNWFCFIFVSSGFKGTKGRSGFTGRLGLQGLKGVKGDQGLPGLKGLYLSGFEQVLFGFEQINRIKLKMVLVL